MNHKSDPLRDTWTFAIVDRMYWVVKLLIAFPSTLSAPASTRGNIFGVLQRSHFDHKTSWKDFLVIIDYTRKCVNIPVHTSTIAVLVDSKGHHFPSVISLEAQYVRPANGDLPDNIIHSHAHVTKARQDYGRSPKPKFQPFASYLAISL
ncbi:hypothetical protein V1477_005270 [Vespula maculifrons]|uniref:Uncharacterized protein n=1 Tax=Vespula maculifrons TaxID=7453 RepID=A0ABD2CP65_VESMC